eukprot:scaffold24467_cov108-Skeletonema_dohrnii-CCMP3373.AAC.7
MRAGGVFVLARSSRNARALISWQLKYSAGKLSIIPMPPSRVLEAWNLCFSNHEYRYKQRQRGSDDDSTGRGT